MSILDEHVGLPRNCGQTDLEATRERRRMAISGKRAKTQMVGGLDPNFFYYWHSDVLGNLSLQQMKGYVFVLKGEVDFNLNGSHPESLDSRVGMLMGKDEYGHAVMAYLMKIPRDIYEDNQQMQHEGDFQVFDRIRKGPAPGGPFFSDNREGLDRGGRRW